MSSTSDQAAIHRPPSGARRILAVDDDQGARSVVAKALSRAGYEVDVAADGPQALELVRQREYALIVLDYEMPLMNGIELFRFASSIQPEMIGVFLTAHVRLDTVFPAIISGIKRVLSKPIQSDELVSLVRELVPPDGRRAES